MKTIRLMSLVSLLGLFACGNGFKSLDVNSFERTLDQGGVTLVDVRTPEEYAEGHLPGAVNCDCQAEDFLTQAEAAFPKETPLAVYCRTGKRSAEAAKQLAKASYTVCDLTGGILAWADAGKRVTRYEVESFTTPGGKKVAITLIKHGSLEICYDGLSLQFDPVSGLGKPTDYAAEFPKADYLFVTHEHGDHYDPTALDALQGEKTVFITNARCAEMRGSGEVMANGDSRTLRDDIRVDAVPAYNYSEGRTNFHPKGRDNGFILTLDGFRIYVAGDTEDVPEMADIKDIDVAFLPVNQPYTMTVDQCVAAAKVLQPKVLIPYHFSQTDLSSLPEQLPGVTVLLRQMQ